MSNSTLNVLPYLMAAAFVAASIAAAGEIPVSAVHRSDFIATSEPAVEIFVREVTPTISKTTGVPILLVHGGGPGGLASFDLPVPGYSLAADLAGSGHPVYVMDVRGWGASTRPPAMNEPAEANPPAVTVDEAARDIGTVVDWIGQRNRGGKVALFGWASGGHWSAYYTTRQANMVSHLVILNSLYGVRAPWALGPAFEDPKQPGQFHRNAGAYRTSDAASLLARWNQAIPVDDKSAWREPHVAEAYLREALASDPMSDTLQPPAMRTPIAFRLEAYEMSRGRKYWDAQDIRVPTLVVRGELDHWSRLEDLAALERELTNAPVKRMISIPDGTHYLFLDRPERGRTTLLRSMIAFLKNGA